MNTEHTRLWLKKEGESNWELIETKDAKLSDIDTGERAVFMVEMKINKVWPRDQEPEEP